MLSVPPSVAAANPFDVAQGKTLRMAGSPASQVSACHAGAFGVGGLGVDGSAEHGLA
jgi:hypothetical protein